MKNKHIYISILVILLAVGFSIYSHPDSAKAKCPDDYATNEAGEKAYMASTDKWTNNFYDSHPGATLVQWAEARRQFWIDNNCTLALQRYEEAKNGKADPATLQMIKTNVKKAIDMQ